MRSADSRTRSTRRGITLIEVLVAIGLIGLLMSLLMPAAQSARGAARRAACQNNLRQIGVAILSHESTHQRFPANGWGFQWIGEPGRSTDEAQPGGWIYNILPEVDQAALRERGSDLSASARRQALGELSRTPLPLFHCPERAAPSTGPANPDVAPVNADWQPNVAKTDYAINEGDWISDTGRGPLTLAEGDKASYPWKDVSLASGISFQRSRVRAADVTDGLSQTYLVGEKYVGLGGYQTSGDSGYDQSMYSGVDLDLNRWTIETPLWDGNGQSTRSFGSAHSDGCHLLYCDGSVHSVSYSVDAEVHRSAGNRRDGAQRR